MTSDTLYYHGQTRTAVHDIAASVDATGQGLEVLAAVAGATLYAKGFIVWNNSPGAITFTPSAGVEAVGVIPIGAPVEVGAFDSAIVEFVEPASAEAANTNIGVVTSAAIKMQAEAWGYYAT